MDASDDDSVDVPVLWTHCLAAARRRRAGIPATQSTAALAREEAALGAGLRWEAPHGCRLHGVWSPAAQSLFRLLKPLLDRPAGGAPWTIGQLGQSLDGCVATQTGDSYFVTGPDSLVHLHRLRALCDAVIVGGGTVAADNPQLTTRRVPGSHPVRVVLDPGLRVAPDACVFTDGQAPTLLVCDALRQAEAAQRVGADQVLPVPGLMDAHGEADLGAMVQALAARGLRLLFVEGGGVTVSRFVAQGWLDRLHLIVAPVVIGRGGRPGLQLPGRAAMADCLRPAHRVFPLGGDVLWDLDLRAGQA